MSYFPLAVGKLGQEVGPLVTLAQKYHAAPGQIALAWLLARSPQIVLIPGTSSVTHLEENIASVAIMLTQEEQQSLATNSEISSI
jgi:aryl-alcohol dehydrogenase-like predicted oxidoreductase